MFKSKFHFDFDSHTKNKHVFDIINRYYLFLDGERERVRESKSEKRIIYAYFN